MAPASFDRSDHSLDSGVSIKRKASNSTLAPSLEPRSAKKGRVQRDRPTQVDINTAIAQYQQIHVRVMCKNPYQTVGTLVAYLKMSGGKELKKFYAESPLRANVLEPFARARNNAFGAVQKKSIWRTFGSSFDECKGLTLPLDAAAHPDPLTRAVKTTVTAIIRILEEAPARYFDKPSIQDMPAVENISGHYSENINRAYELLRGYCRYCSDKVKSKRAQNETDTLPTRLFYLTDDDLRNHVDTAADEIATHLGDGDVAYEAATAISEMFTLDKLELLHSRREEFWAYLQESSTTEGN